MLPYFHYSLILCLYDSTITWFHLSIILLFYGPLVPQFCDSLILWFFEHGTLLAPQNQTSLTALHVSLSCSLTAHSILLPQPTCACARLTTGNGSDDASRRSRLIVWAGEVLKKEREEKKVFQLLTIFSMPSNKQNPQSCQLLQNCHFYPGFSTKQLRAVSAVPWHKTTGGCGSCFCWAQNREAIYFGCISVQWVMFRLENWPQLSRRSLLPAKLACYSIPPSSLSPPLHPLPQLGLPLHC